MDLRVQRTRKNIRDAFIELRSRKPIEKITVKELAEAAFINKATFYQHYEDLYDLSESMENELIDNIISSIPHPEGDLEKEVLITFLIQGSFHAYLKHSGPDRGNGPAAVRLIAALVKRLQPFPDELPDENTAHRS